MMTYVFELRIHKEVSMLSNFVFLKLKALIVDKKYRHKTVNKTLRLMNIKCLNGENAFLVLSVSNYYVYMCHTIYPTEYLNL